MSEKAQTPNPVWLALGGHESGNVNEEVFNLLTNVGSLSKVGDSEDGKSMVFKDDFGKSYAVYSTEIPVNIKDKKNPNSYKLFALTDEEATRKLGL